MSSSDLIICRIRGILSELRHAVTRLSEIVIETSGRLSWTRQILFEIATSISMIVRIIYKVPADLDKTSLDLNMISPLLNIKMMMGSF